MNVELGMRNGSIADFRIRIAELERGYAPFFRQTLG